VGSLWASNALQLAAHTASGDGLRARTDRRSPRGTTPRSIGSRQRDPEPVERRIRERRDNGPRSPT
jgi:hypothetical protein